MITAVNGLIEHNVTFVKACLSTKHLLLEGAVIRSEEKSIECEGIIEGPHFLNCPQSFTQRKGLHTDKKNTHIYISACLYTHTYAHNCKKQQLDGLAYIKHPTAD